MRSIVFAGAAVAALALAAAAPASAAALIHAYDFSADVGGYVIDHAGSADGQLLGGAAVSGGVLHLDGVDDYVQFGQHIVPNAGADFSVLLRVQIAASQAGIAEIISQGFSGASGFYIGTNGGAGFRLTDAHGAPGVALPSAGAFHNLLLTNGADGFNFYIDGAAPAFTAGKVTDFNTGTDTRLGRQFGGYSEFLGGQIDTLKIYDGVVSYDAATRVSAAPEPASWALMILGFGGAATLLRRRRRDGDLPQPP